MVRAGQGMHACKDETALHVRALGLGRGHVAHMVMVADGHASVVSRDASQGDSGGRSESAPQPNS